MKNLRTQGRGWFGRDSMPFKGEVQEDHPDRVAAKEAYLLSTNTLELTEGDIAEWDHNKRMGWENSDDLQKKIDYTEMMLTKEPSFGDNPQYATEAKYLAKEKEREKAKEERDDFLNRDRTQKMDDDSTYGLLDEDYFSYLDKDREDYLLMHGEDIDKKRMESQDQDREDYLLRHGTDPEVSGGMTNSAFGGDTDRKMSPKSQQYALSLLKDMMTPEQDDAPQQVRGAGIIKGSGTPFPSLLQKKPERQYYRNKGLV